MSFLFRSLFQGGAGSAEPGPSQQPFASSHPGMMGAASSSHPLMQSSAPSFSQSPADSPFKMSGAPLFKTAGNEAVAAPPINSAVGMSPFSVQGAASTSYPLTVGDVMTQIPPEIARAGALPAEHPLSLPPALLESALRSGEPALPLFELYRVCPKLFQTPVSPQDPRLVKLPAAKLPGLIARPRMRLSLLRRRSRRLHLRRKLLRRRLRHSPQRHQCHNFKWLLPRHRHLRARQHRRSHPRRCGLLRRRHRFQWGELPLKLHQRVPSCLSKRQLPQVGSPQVRLLRHRLA